MNLKVKRHFDVKYFNEFQLELRYDSVGSTFSFSLYFDPENEQHRVLWQPGHYHQVDVEHNGELLIRGFILSQKFTSSDKKQLAHISGYSLSGVLEDCQIPTDIYPLQSDGKTLRQIASRILSYFKLGVEVDSSVSAKVNSVFDKTTAGETQTIKQYLASMASQKNIVLSHTPEGNLLFTKAKTKQRPLIHFNGQTLGTTFELSFSGQPMHSTITLQKQASAEGGNAGESSIRNPYVPYVRRPKVAKQSSGTDNDTGDAARKALSEELKNITLTITTSQWEIDGKVIKPNTIIAVTNPEIYHYRRVDWFVESVSLKGNEKETVATLKCVLPETFNEDAVINVFEEMADWRKFNKEHGL